MTTLRRSSTSSHYDNNGQYSRTSILRYEKIFGKGYISTGGPATTDYLCQLLGDKLKPGVRVLDVGSGIGGAAFHLAKQYGAKVVGVDLSPEMTDIAHEATADSGVSGQVEFLLADVLETEFDEPFDVVWSRDALMHIHDKNRLFAKLHSLLVDGGQLVVTDYARGPKPSKMPEFDAYVKSTGYHLVEPSAYGKLLEEAGFTDVIVEDATPKFVEILKAEPLKLEAIRDDFLGAFSESDLNYLVERWAMKVKFCDAGDMKWGIYKATRRA
jgi:phosphoethanolamine N-methyltransferase